MRPPVRSTVRWLSLPFVCACLVFTAVAVAEPGPGAQAEIDHLLEFIRTSTCRFVRNGRDYDGDRAFRHVMRKYRYFADRIESAEDFIAFSATESTMSGDPYQFVCNGIARESGPTLLDELARFRRAESERSAAGDD